MDTSACGRTNHDTVTTHIPPSVGQPAEEAAGTVGGYKVEVRYTAPQDVKARSMGS
jgi:hypothetical protein